MTDPIRRLPPNESAVAAPGVLPGARPATLSDEVVLADASALELTWADKRGLWGWLTAVDHKTIAKRYILTAFLMFSAGGVEAALMRMQLARP